jgi:hypothetical protein
LNVGALQKISMKNAFDLKLIDALPDAIKNETFSVSSSRLLLVE